MEFEKEMRTQGVDFDGYGGGGACGEKMRERERERERTWEEREGLSRERRNMEGFERD